MKSTFLKTMLFVGLFNSSLYSNILLQAPSSISEADIEKKAQDWFTIFSWMFPYKIRFTLSYAQQQAGFAISCCQVPCYSSNSTVIFKALEQVQSLDFRRNYYYGKPLKHENVNPESINFEQLVEMLQYKKFIFYTGAGISAGSVATMSSLEKSLNLDQGCLKLLKTAWKNPDLIKQEFVKFCNSAVQGLPSQAHYAIKNIAMHKSCAIVTENVDLLQQKTGIDPIFTGSNQIDLIRKEDISEIDHVVCVGLSHDDRGFLSYLKEKNPQICFIAIDLQQPNYLFERDYLLQGDIQEILPKLESQLIRK